MDITNKDDKANEDDTEKDNTIVNTEDIEHEKSNIEILQESQEIITLYDYIRSLSVSELAIFFATEYKECFGTGESYLKILSKLKKEYCEEEVES